jgi:hypothetical protein
LSGQRLQPLSCVALSLVTACSWAFVDPPPLYYDPSFQAPSCTQSVAAPVADTVLAAGFTAIVVGVVIALERAKTTTTSGQPTGGFNPGVLLILPAGLAAIPYTFSAVYGYRKTARCRRITRIKAR